ncbi:hypothetical protein [Paenibacillus sp. KN14-4R]|uniref:hypothetical protein n=1 Tax=Paenibacillus sp. KN14-4R TaxID=3445773 RepID=UPI003F9F0768
MLIQKEISQIENKIDEYLFSALDRTIPRYKFIYHMNLAYIDFVVDKKIWFTTSERHFMFSLSYNTFLAYKTLEEEEVFDFKFDKNLYIYCHQFLIKGMQYSMLCDNFSATNTGKSNVRIEKSSNSICFEKNRAPRLQYDFFCKYKIRKALSYTLQMVSGMLNENDEEDAALELSKVYLNFWNENMLYEDFEPYSRQDWGGVTLFFTQAAMRRYIKLYRNDFDIAEVDSQKMMIILSPKGSKNIADFTISKDKIMIDQVINDFIYKPLGDKLYPKANIIDAPIIKTKDGFLFVNPLILLFNDSSESRLLNYLRRYDHSRHQRVKDKLKERIIPIIMQLLKLKYPEAIVQCNFKLPIPLKKNQKRELDILIVDNATGFVLYVEVKHFFNPISYSESKNLDSELQKAISKTSEQLYAIEENWDLIKQRFGVTSDIKVKKAIILSHQYLGKDVEINKDVPIVDPSNFYESIAEAKTIAELYHANKEIDDIYTKIKMISREIDFDYAGLGLHFKRSA